MTKLIESNTTIPTKKSQVFSTAPSKFKLALKQMEYWTEHSSFPKNDNLRLSFL